MEFQDYSYEIGDLQGALEAKNKLTEISEKKLSSDQIKKVEKDYHSKKSPYPACGMTIHPAVGCSSKCVYCYVPHNNVKISPLNGQEMAYSIIRSPYFFPGKNGTFLAFGSITDPLLPAVRSKTFDIINEIYQTFGNPIQISTKQVLTWDEMSESIGEILNQICLLVSCSTTYSSDLEPFVPSFQHRMNFIKELRTRGTKSFVFLRPIIPGITNKNTDELTNMIKNVNPLGVVLGSLKLNQPTFERLQNTIDSIEINNRLQSKKLGKGFQYVFTNDIKQNLSNQIHNLGLQPFHSACCANAVTHNVVCVNACWKNPQICTKCSNQCFSQKLPEIPSTEEIQEFIITWLGKQNYIQINHDLRKISLYVKASAAVRIGVKRVLETLLRAKVQLTK